jgi:hypothetical protein
MFSASRTWLSAGRSNAKFRSARSMATNHSMKPSTFPPLFNPGMRPTFAAKGPLWDVRCAPTSRAFELISPRLPGWWRQADSSLTHWPTPSALAESSTSSPASVSSSMTQASPTSVPYHVRSPAAASCQRDETPPTAASPATCAAPASANTLSWAGVPEKGPWCDGVQPAGRPGVQRLRAAHVVRCLAGDQRTVVPVTAEFGILPVLRCLHQTRGSSTQAAPRGGSRTCRGCTCPQRDSNPCYRLERAASWATRR